MSVKKACEALGVSRGGYYAFLNRPKSSRRIVVELRKIGIVANGKTVQRMMARKGLVSCRGARKYRRGERPRTKEPMS